MVSLDHQLIHEAERLLNGANEHQLRGLINNYQLAVSLHNQRWRNFEVYPMTYERKLRDYVKLQQAKTLRQAE